MTATLTLPHGPLMLDLQGLEMTAEERSRLLDPRVGGVILFARNYESRAQLTALTREIHALRTPHLLIGIDHEGGRVQRCREGFTRLPAMQALGSLWNEAGAAALASAEAIGFVLATELRECGVDLSFTPVLDLDWGRNHGAIGSRAFHRDPDVVIALAGALIRGLKAAGMAACGKHFPGHGWAEADSHYGTPIDDRDLEALAPDLAPYRALPLDAVMPAHVIFPKLDANTACFSEFWHHFLRNTLNFNGLVFSDDLSMAGAGAGVGVVERVERAWHAGCDMLLVCNSPESAIEVLERWHPAPKVAGQLRIARLLPTQPALGLRDDPRYRAGLVAASALCERVS